MGESHEVVSAKIQSRGAVWAALIGSAGVILASWIGVNVGRNQGDDKIEELRKQLEARDREISALKQELAETTHPKAGTTPKEAKNTGFQSASSVSAASSKDDQVHQGEVKTAVSNNPIQSANGGDFRFDLFSCQRNGSFVRCSLQVTNTSHEESKTNLCGASYFQDNLNRRSKTTVKFDEAGCKAFRLAPGLPRAFQMSAEVPVDSKEVTVVLADGSWGSFSGSVVFRSIPLQ